MALHFLKGSITKEGKVMIIFSGGGKQVWYPTEIEIDRISKCLIGLEQIKQKVGDLESSLNVEVSNG